MGAKKRAVEESEEEPSRTAGACVLLVLAAVVTAVVFAISPTAGVLAVWVLGAVLLWRAAGRMSDSSATPPPPLSGDVYAGHGDEIARVQEGPGEGLTILYPVREEEVNET
ncbi:hypothetical protein [Streptomyces phaeochromogenes]|uniref:hypothetical protein n=1 Tax=Streptomyces phaeochromogenes TaxID=1923 RepID=UPI002DDB42D6|nr:hypothetical protein [Streptomyces phaeochromogenes]WRZ31351.1 hypothetical protein OG931_28205 [Streptomyces phaeochromogenes]